MSAAAPPNPPTAGESTGEHTAARPPRSATVVFCTAVLVLEAFVVLFASLVAIGFEIAPRQVIWGVGLSISALCLVLSGLTKRRFATIAGTVIQALLIGSGFLIPGMFIVGGIFAVIWVVALRLGARIDRERAERAQAEREQAEPR